MSRKQTALGGVMAGVMLLGVAACAPEPSGHRPGAAHFASAEYGVAMVYPASLKAARDFRSDYFLQQRWNPDAADHVPGKALLTLTLPRSDRLTTAELRLGVSDNRQAVRDCALPSHGQAGTTSAVVIDGVAFKRRDTEDAGMNHFMLRHAYRGVAHGRCYAIDLIVDGTNPGVYPDNPTPPMTNRAAFKQLTALLDGLTFSSR